MTLELQICAPNFLHWFWEQMYYKSVECMQTRQIWSVNSWNMYLPDSVSHIRIHVRYKQIYSSLKHGRSDAAWTLFNKFLFIRPVRTSWLFLFSTVHKQAHFLREKWRFNTIVSVWAIAIIITHFPSAGSTEQLSGLQAFVNLVLSKWRQLLSTPTPFWFMQVRLYFIP